jgi:hypothetical protein
VTSRAWPGRTRPLLAVPLAALASHCSPAVHCAPRAPPGVPADSSRALPVAYYSPDDFDWRTLVLELPPAPSGKTVLVVTPGTRLHDLVRAGQGWRDERVPIDDTVDSMCP